MNASAGILLSLDTDRFSFQVLPRRPRSWKEWMGACPGRGVMSLLPVSSVRSRYFASHKASCMLQLSAHRSWEKFSDFLDPCLLCCSARPRAQLPPELSIGFFLFLCPSHSLALTLLIHGLFASTSSAFSPSPSIPFSGRLVSSWLLASSLFHPDLSYHVFQKFFNSFIIRMTFILSF